MDSLKLALDLAEQALKAPAKSLREVNSNADRDLFVADWSAFIRIYKHKVPELNPWMVNEYQFYRQIVDKKYPVPVPEIGIYHPQGHKLERYVAHDEMLNKKTLLETRLEIDSILFSVSLLHAAPFVDYPFLPLERFRYFQKRAKAALPESFENEILLKSKQIFDSFPLVACHNHLKRSHLAQTEEIVYLMDLSSVGLNVGLFDVASLVAENNLDSSMARYCLQTYNRLDQNNTYTYEELDTLVAFVQAYYYYYYRCKNFRLNDSRTAKLAEMYKRAFLMRFEASIMEDAE